MTDGCVTCGEIGSHSRWCRTAVYTQADHIRREAALLADPVANRDAGMRAAYAACADHLAGIVAMIENEYPDRVPARITLRLRTLMHVCREIGTPPKPHY